MVAAAAAASGEGDRTAMDARGGTLRKFGKRALSVFASKVRGLEPLWAGANGQLRASRAWVTKA